MPQQRSKLEVASEANAEAAEPAAKTADQPRQPRAYIDPLESTRGGLSGVFESVLRRFKNLTTLLLITPIYALGCIILGSAIAPGLAVFDFLHGFASNQPAWLSYLTTGVAVAAGYFTYGFSLLLIVPFVNFVFRARPKPWRGPYHSLEVIRWYIHNGLTYLVRYTFLEFVTPTPFNLMFFRLMGMKIGRGTAINSTWISDPALIEMGEKVTIGGSVTLIGHYGQGGFLVLAKTRIGDRVTIGLKATIMGGVTIEDGAKVLANSLVLPKTVVPAGETWGGVPARKLEL